MRNLARSTALILGMAACGIASTGYAQSSPSAYTSATRYDAMGRVTGTIAPDPDGGGALKYAATRTTYDNRALPVKVETGELSSWKSESIAPANWSGFTVLSSVETFYDNNRRKIKTVAKGSNGAITGVTQFSYDSRGRLLCTAVRMNPAVYGSLPSSACTLGTAGSEGPDRITKNIYDAASQVLKIQKAVGTSIQQDYVTYTYTLNGKQASVTDANGNRAAYTYDAYDRLIKWNFPHKTSTGATSSSDYEAYTYDANGNRLTHRKRDGSVLSYQYDKLNRMTRKIVPARSGLSSTHTRDVFYSYDNRGLQLRARFDSINGEGVTNAYDGFGRMTSSQINMSGLNKTLTYTHDKNGNRTQVKHPDNQQFNYTFDGLNRSDLIKRSTQTLVDYGYNNRGLTSGITGGVTSAFAYDPVGRLSSLTHNLYGSSNDVTYSFGFNPASQVKNRTISNHGYVWTDDVNVSRNYAVNGLNQYTSAGPASFTYDANGNLTSDGSSSYLYDIENRLVSATGATTANLRYDPLGRLFETSGGSAGTTRFHYDGDELIAEYNSSHALLRRYVHGASVDDPMIWYEGAGVSTSAARRLRSDHQGSITAVTNWSGSAIAINAYDDWGIPAATNLGRFQYTGQAHIPELDMYHYKARIYSPTLGRFLQTDPIGYEDQVNLYAYVGNDPMNMLDPKGMFTLGTIQKNFPIMACHRGTGTCGTLDEVLAATSRDNGGNRSEGQRTGRALDTINGALETINETLEAINEPFVGDIKDAVDNPNAASIGGAIIGQATKPLKAFKPLKPNKVRVKFRTNRRVTKPRTGKAQTIQRGRPAARREQKALNSANTTNDRRGFLNTIRRWVKGIEDDLD